MPQPPKELNKIESLRQIISDLRGPNGCPWDKEQNHVTLAPYAIEEAAELAEALELNDDQEICEELGDVLFQVVLHAQLAEERSAFVWSDIVKTISEKIIRRHPHVFSDLKIQNKDEVLKNWDEIKKQEKITQNKPIKNIQVPEGLPALQRADKIGEKTRKYKFDWNEPLEVLAQLKSEITELEEALIKKTQKDIIHEIGDVLFSTAQLARHCNIDAEFSLREANRRFLNRFEKMLDIGQVSIDEFTHLNQHQKEILWKKAKNFF